MSSFRHPVLALSHGPGPLWLLDHGFDGMNKSSVPAQNLRQTFPKLYGSEGSAPLPKRILYVTAHWESETDGAFEISSASNPEMIYDYYGFPNEAYDVVYGAKGDPVFAKRVSSLLAKSNIKTKLVNRGFDHGVFVPMFLIRPEADIPVLSVSINDHLNAKAHFELGQALAPLRDEETLIICSGQATHNLRASRIKTDNVADWAKEFQDWMDKMYMASPLSFKERRAQLESWHSSAPSARLAHPSPDHFSPFIVAAGAGMTEEKPESEKLFSGWAMGHMSFATYAWGVVH